MNAEVIQLTILWAKEKRDASAPGVYELINS